jgi:tripartite-type tricarboxylate transporter receptor subunit TctC
MERGEVEGTFANAWSSIRGAEPEWLTSGKVRIIVQHGFRKHPALPEVPSIFELATSESDRQALVFMLARQEAAKPYFAPPQVPVAQLTVLRRAFDEMVRDPKFLDLAHKAAVTLDQPMSGEEVTALVASVAQTPAAVIARVNRMLTDKK